MIRNLRVATRQSPLAVWQADCVIQSVTTMYPSITCEKVLLKTTGDNLIDRPLYEVDGKALFLKELEEALLDDRADIAVHSYKDVPAVLPQGLQIGAVMKRDNPLDAFVAMEGATFLSLPKNACVGTSSLRRKAQLSALREDITIVPLRGNIHTRIKKLQNGEYDAIILAAAGLERMAIDQHIQHYFMPDECVPAVAQGVICIEFAEYRSEIKELLANISHDKTQKTVNLERIFLKTLGGSCREPVGCFVEEEVDGFCIYAFVADESLSGCFSYHREFIPSKNAEKHMAAFAAKAKAELNNWLNSA